MSTAETIVYVCGLVFLIAMAIWLVTFALVVEKSMADNLRQDEMELEQWRAEMRKRFE